VSLPGNFNGWNTSAQALTPGAPPNTNIYTTTLTYSYYPIGAQNVGFYKFYVSGSSVARDGGWENPISNGGGNRAFAINSVAQTNLYFYNDENPVFSATSVQKLDADSAKITWQSFPTRPNIPTGGVYKVESRSSLNSSSWTIIGTNASTTTSTSITNTGLIGTPRQFYRVSLIGL